MYQFCINHNSISWCRYWLLIRTYAISFLIKSSYLFVVTLGLLEGLYMLGVTANWLKSQNGTLFSHVWIFTISLFLSLSPTFPWRVLLRSFLFCPFFFNFFKQLSQRVIFWLFRRYSFFLSRSPRVDLDGRNCHTTTSNKYYL